MVVTCQERVSIIVLSFAEEGQLLCAFCVFRPDGVEDFVQSVHLVRFGLAPLLPPHPGFDAVLVLERRLPLHQGPMLEQGKTIKSLSENISFTQNYVVKVIYANFDQLLIKINKHSVCYTLLSLH